MGYIVSATARIFGVPAPPRHPKTKRPHKGDSYLVVPMQVKKKKKKKQLIQDFNKQGQSKTRFFNRNTIKKDVN